MPFTDRFHHTSLLAFPGALGGATYAAGLAERAERWAGICYAGNNHTAASLVGVCGAGAMGAGIAAAHLKHKMRVRLFDASSDALERGVSAVRSELAATWAAHRGSAGNGSHPAPWLYPCTADSELGPCELIIESIVENKDLKQRVLQRIESLVAPQTILTTNTSTIPLAELAVSLRDPTRFCGMHFCYPVAHRRLVEIVQGSRTSEQTIQAAVAHACRIGKLPIVVRDSPGFVVNRLLVAYLNESLDMVCQGADVRAIDKVATRFGMAVGPFELLDSIGIDTAIMAGRTLWEAFPDRVALTPVLPALAKRGRLGRKTNLGFYKYSSETSAGERDARVDAILAPYIREYHQHSEAEIARRLFLPMLLEATRVLEDGVVDDPRDVDTALIYGLAFPRARGGLLYWADQVGVRQILDWLAPLQSFGARMQPTRWLHALAAKGGRFCDTGS